ncbi:MAG: mechanosensitive ion channel family protein [Treponema sp.]|jgi:miniconductance mechanosensitive channel|nr:mechanosensitive ion channel family protein [Treponema sp.]
MNVVEFINSIMSPILYEEVEGLDHLSEGISIGISVLCLLGIAALSERLVRFTFSKIIPIVVKHTKAIWDDQLLESGFFRRFARIISPVLLYMLFPIFVPFKGILTEGISRCLLAYLAVMVAHTVAAVLDGLNLIYQSANDENAKKRPIKGYLQMIKVLVYIIGIILAITVLANVSPLGILGGLGAMSAVLMLVFKDPLMGLVASMQLSSNDMVRIGDWIEMPKHEADGSVIDMTLQSIMVKNWDNTITTVPLYALVSDSFKNYRSMFTSGGRRIKRAIFLDMRTIRLLSHDEMSRLSKLRLLSEHITTKRNEIVQHNGTEDIPEGIEIVDGRFTEGFMNINLYLAYVKAYLAEHPQTSKDLIHMARYLAPEPQGLPLEIYCFCTNTQWIYYEQIQADIIEHLLGVLPEFGLRPFQQPSSWDIATLTGK